MPTHQQWQSDLHQLQNRSECQKLTEQQIFNIIGELDKKHEGSINYTVNIDGIISNIGEILGYRNLLKFSVKRLKIKVQQHPINKLNYDLGNTISRLAQLGCQNPSSIANLLATTDFNEARVYFKKVSKNDDHYPSAITNSANILNKYGRNYEAIHLYDTANKAKPSFGMAYANKANAIEYYIQLSLYKSLRLMNMVKELYEKAMLDSSLEEIGGSGIREQFAKRIATISSYLNENGYDAEKDKLKPAVLPPYLQFCLDKNLFLNYDFGFYYDDISIEDSFFPSFIESLEEDQHQDLKTMSERIYFCFQVYNEMHESYTTERFNFFQACTSDYTEIDKLVHYTYTYDYTKHSYKYGALKSVFCSLYNCLDKIGHLLYYYFIWYKKNDKKDIYFSWLLGKGFKDVIIEQDSFHLLALHNLALDFEGENRYSYLKKLRNRITHSFLCINTGIAYDSRFESYQITEDMLIEAVENMFMIVKSAVMYSVLAFKNQKKTGQHYPKYAIQERDIFF